MPEILTLLTCDDNEEHFFRLLPKQYSCEGDSTHRILVLMVLVSSLLSQISLQPVTKDSASDHEMLADRDNFPNRDWKSWEKTLS